MNSLIIIGAGGHGKVIADIAFKIGYTNIYFLDDNATGSCIGFSILGKVNDAERFNDGNADYIIGIGNNKIRKKVAEAHPELNYVTLIHPTAVVGISVDIGVGTVIMPGAIINPCTHIGRHCIINSVAIVEHDNVLGDYVHISPNSALGGTVRVGNGTHIGIGSTIRNNIEICGECTIGAGAVVVRDIEETGVYVGIPAKCKIY